MSRRRSSAVVLLLFGLHITLFAHLRPFGVAPDVLLLGALVGGLVGDDDFGGRHGFACGLLVDLMAPGPFGLAAGIYGAMGYGAGVVAQAFDPQDPSVGPLIVAVGSFLAVVSYGLGLAVLGTEQFVEWRLVLVAALSGVYNVVLFPPVRAVYGWATSPDRSLRGEAPRSVVN